MGDVEQANKQCHLPHSLWHEHEHDAHIVGYWERHQSHDTGVLPHMQASKCWGYQPCSSAALLRHMKLRILEQCSQGEGKHSKWVVSTGWLAREGEERGHGNHVRNWYVSP